MKINELLQSATKHLANGDFFHAEAMFREVLTYKPSNPEALHFLGLALHQQGKSSDALPFLEKSIKVSPTNSIFQHNAALVLLTLHRYKDALERIQKALTLNPKFGTAHFTCGEIECELKNYESALQHFRRSFALGNENPEARIRVITLLLKAQRLEDALELARAAREMYPANESILYILGVALAVTGEHLKAKEIFIDCLARSPANVDLICKLAAEEVALNNIEAAVSRYLDALKCQPGDFSARTKLALLYGYQHKYEDARQEFAVAIQHSKESFDQVFPTYLLTLQYDPSVTDEFVSNEHRRYGGLIDERNTKRSGVSSWPNSVCADRPLRIGYVSADFRDHPVSRFLIPILENHDRNAFKLFAYYTWPTEDEYTKRIKSSVEKFHQCTDVGDDELVRKISADEIDILIDLSGHTGGNRLNVFSMRAAPIQVTYIGYPGTTGLRNMDYRMTDDRTDPIGLTEWQHTEKLVRLETSTAPFSLDVGAPEVNQLPALRVARFTYGCLNNPLKINEHVVRTWAQILTAVPNSSILIGNMDDPTIKSRIVELFDRFGVGEERLDLRNRVSIREFLMLHHSIDLMLDPFPYNGGTSTWYSLWMGVPVLTLAGTRSAARGGASLLGNANLGEYVAQNKTEYISLAIDASAECGTLNDLRLSMRGRLLANPAFNHCNIIRSYEAALRSIWSDYCTKKSN
jgi:protein O-GlcNAc transferase